ncbi:hypothetical protein GCM10011348_13030 [Marinobacterium nitratireducens]|uniref:Dimethylamine monooxygenase subunit DmmA-like C-terminal domain-containing protein n=1 Tax=Marinobacterium nitratireducens TaxID=518897 RepID=A0A918DRP1_9GAMM|nr:dimethylamine monooxygenase subunit DmmA family protein [Marinobacterium nitratireducens]GGO79237.1 hypothetical protein GCM10011348_13030 [Marinobacterium nitratireducens]
MQAATAIDQGPSQTSADLQPQAQYHLFICEGGGLRALSTLIAKAASANRSVLVVGQGSDAGIESACYCSEGQAAAEICAVLLQAPLDTAIYVAGSQSFREDVQNQARTLGFSDTQIRIYTPQSALYRVFCTHCYTSAEYHRHQGVVCRNCKRSLRVRERYSPYLGAYVGVTARPAVAEAGAPGRGD